MEKQDVNSVAEQEAKLAKAIEYLHAMGSWDVSVQHNEAGWIDHAILQRADQTLHVVFSHLIGDKLVNGLNKDGLHIIPCWRYANVADFTSLVMTRLGVSLEMRVFYIKGGDDFRCMADVVGLLSDSLLKWNIRKLASIEADGFALVVEASA